MQVSETIKRLLYKELRESWVVVLALFVLPAVVITMDRSGRKSEYIDGLVMFTSFLMPVLMVTWAVSKSDVKNGGVKAFSGGLPVNAMLEWFTSTVLPVVVVFPLGIWVAWWFSLTSVSPDQTQVLASGLLFTAMFTAAMVAARLTSIWVGLGAALGAALVGETIVTVNKEPIGAVGVIVTALVLSLISVLARKKTVKVRGAWSVGWLVVVVGAYLVGYTPNAESLLDWRESHDISPSCVMVDNACTVRTDPVPGQRARIRLTVTTGGPPGFGGTDSRVTRVRDSYAETTPVGAHGDDLYLIVPPRNVGRHADILRWNLKQDTMTTLCRIPTRRWVFVIWGVQTSLSDDGTQLLIALPTILGTGMKIEHSDYLQPRSDIWLVDVRTGSKRLCAADLLLAFGEVAWSSENVFISGDFGIASLGRNSGKPSSVNIPAKEALR